MIHRIVLLLLFFASLIGGCKNGLSVSENDKTMKIGSLSNADRQINKVEPNMCDLLKTVIYAEVENVEPVSSATFTLKLWTVRLKVKEVINEGEAKIGDGDKIELFVHSVIKTFLVDADNIRGETFKITYIEPFSKKYEGELEVQKIKGED